MADPYAGLMIGEQPEDVPWFFDFGMSPMGGMAAWLGLGILSHKVNSPASTRRMLRRTARTGKQFLWYNKRGAFLGSRSGNYLDLRSDIKALMKERRLFGMGRELGTRNLNWRLWQRARQGGYKLGARYGADAALRIGAGAALQGALGVLDVIGGLYLGASAVEGLANAISNWTPATASSPSVDFGSEASFYMPRAASTQRMRALQAIHNSQLGVRAALGSEASYMHG